MPGPTAAAAPPGRPWKSAFLWLLFLGPFFFGTYGFANWLASRRSDVGSVVFDWEPYIPFLAWTIVPYWTIDLLYALSLFVCATREELQVHVRRLLAAQVIAVACFIAFPLRFVFERPETEGLFGWMFDVLTGFDKPFNQAPSLHIALLVIIWVLYDKRATGAWNAVLHGWFALIAVSVLTTYQHHFIDLPTGVWAGWLCLWLFPEGRRSPLSEIRLTGDPMRLKLAVYYGAAALLLATVAALARGSALWLLWPAASLAMVAAIYACLDEEAFQKSPDGSLSPAARWLLGPYVLGAWLNSRWWTRAASNADTIVPSVLLGRLPTAGERGALGVRSIVDVSAELPCDSRGIGYRVIPMLDLITPPARRLAEAAEAIEASLPRGPVLVCCALGFSRSALVIAAWLLRSGRAARAEEAIAQIHRARPGVVFHAGHTRAIEEFARRDR